MARQRLRILRCAQNDTPTAQLLCVILSAAKNPYSPHTRRWLAVLLLVALLLPAFPGAVSADDPVTTGLKRVWERTDSPQARGDRPYIWGPTPTIPAIEELLRMNLVENSRIMGSYLKDECLKLKDKYGFIGDVRGLGLLLGIEMVRDRETKAPFPGRNALVPKLIRMAMERGLITRGSPHVWHLAPPLIVTKNEIDGIVAILDGCMDEIRQEL